MLVYSLPFDILTSLEAILFHLRHGAHPEFSNARGEPDKLKYSVLRDQAQMFGVFALSDWIDKRGYAYSQFTFDEYQPRFTTGVSQLQAPSDALPVRTTPERQAPPTVPRPQVPSPLAVAPSPRPVSSPLGPGPTVSGNKPQPAASEAQPESQRRAVNIQRHQQPAASKVRTGQLALENAYREDTHDGEESEDDLYGESDSEHGPDESPPDIDRLRKQRLESLRK